MLTRLAKSSRKPSWLSVCCSKISQLATISTQPTGEHAEDFQRRRAERLVPGHLELVFVQGVHDHAIPATLEALGRRAFDDADAGEGAFDLPEHGAAALQRGPARAADLFAEFADHAHHQRREDDR